jgi:transposase
MNTHTTTQRCRARTPKNKTTTGFRISDEFWGVLEPLLSIRGNTPRSGGGRPRVPDRRCADASCDVLRIGCQWEALHQTELCAKSTAPNRCAAWVAAGVLLQLWQAGVERFDELPGLAWSWVSLDGVMTKAPMGGNKTGPNPTDRGTDGVQRRLLTEGHGVPLGMASAGANRHAMNRVRTTSCRACAWTRGTTMMRSAPSGLTTHSRARGEEAIELAREAGKNARRWVVESSQR